MKVRRSALVGSELSIGHLGSTLLAPKPVDQALILKPHGGENGDEESIVVSQSPFKVGRRGDNDAQIARPDISGYHAEFQYLQGNWWIVDNGSTNGTFLNGERILGKVQLHFGDVVYFATKGFQVVQDVDEEESRAFSTKVIGDSSEIKAVMQLLRIVNEQRTYPHFQVITSFATGEPIGWEALGRGVADEGPINAGTLFWLASQNRVEHKLSRRFRESASLCAQCGFCWPKTLRPKLFFNLHPAEILDEKFRDSLAEFARSAISVQFDLVIEMPEAWICKTSEMQSIVKEIRDLGMLVAYDDFGQGHSRIPELTEVPPDYLKLDRQLVADISDNRAKRMMVEAIVRACRDLNVLTIGEGIESEEEKQVCIEMGIDLGQGYLLGRPQPAYEIFKRDTTTLPNECVFVRLELL